MNVLKKQKCVLCGKDVVYRYRPFCSANCKNIDLLNWVKGRYFIPVSKEEEEKADPSQDEGEEDSNES
jgi:endogenous inhibitor of DNA gyrase (YacG/DUF329 family)